jgi:hypothetical protein
MKPLISILFFTMLFCCKIKTERPLPVVFHRDIPIDKKDKPTRLFQHVRYAERSYNLDTIENGIDSMEIRIWLGYGLIDSTQVIVLRNKDNSWKAFFYTIVPHYMPPLDTPVSVDIFKREVFPKRSWGLVLDSLFKDDILTLPDDSKIPGYEWVFDGGTISVEISTLSGYRLYSYSTLSNDEKPPQVLKMENIMNLLTNEFDIKMLDGIL